MGYFLPVFSLILLSAVASHASLPAKVYWHTVLPNTPMPSAVRDLLQPDDLADAKTGTAVTVGKGGVYVNAPGTNVNVGHGGVHVDAGYKKPGGGTNVNVGHSGVHVNSGYKKPGGGTNVNVGHGGVHVNSGYKKPGGGTNVNVGKGGVNVGTGYHKPSGGTNVNVGKGGVNVGTGYHKPGGGTHVNVGKGGVNVNTGHKGKPVNVNVGPFRYLYAATETQIQDDPRVTLFFLEKDLHAGAKMNLDFTHTGTATTFLPKRVADSIPFSSEKVPEVLSRFSIEANSPEADAIKNTVKTCEEPAAEGEQKVCAASLESMVDFSTASLKTHNLIAASTTVEEGAEKEQEYIITQVGGKMAGSELVACHLEPYAYAVFYCHKAHKTTAYNVEMVGENGAKVEAVAVCHADTAGWNPGHVAFKVLKVKPGTVPVCHFVPQNHVVWARRN